MNNNSIENKNMKCVSFVSPTYNMFHCCLKSIKSQCVHGDIGHVTYNNIPVFTYPSKVHTTVHVTCSLCGASFGRKHSLLRHMKIHTREKSCICHYCGKAFRDAGHLKVRPRL